MAVSQNGWPADPAVTRIFIGNDADGCEYRAGGVAKAFAWLMQQFHDTVEPLTTANGYRSKEFNDSLAGSLPNSDHISGTAGDFNGARHPNEWAQRYTGKPYRSGFTAAQTKQVRKLLAYAGIFRWGMDFPVGARDAMHFALRVGVTPAQVNAFAAKVAPKPKPPTKPDIKPPAPKPEPEDDDMPLSQDDIDKIAAAVAHFKDPKYDPRNLYSLTKAGAQPVTVDIDALADAVAKRLSQS